MYFTTNCYLVIYWTSFISLILLIILVNIAYYLSPKLFLMEKISSYECGFQPFHLINMPIEIHFFLIGLTFIIFDLEIMFLYPWFQISYLGGSTGLIGFIIFFLVLIFGFIIEYISGALRWNYL